MTFSMTLKCSSAGLLLEKRRPLSRRTSFGNQLFTERIFPPIVGAVIVALRLLPARGFVE
jgi:hypothetical protein